jgi:hypothetical protein
MDQDPLPDQVTAPPTIDELLDGATDDELDRIADGEDPERVLVQKLPRPEKAATAAGSQKKKDGRR